MKMNHRAVLFLLAVAHVTCNQAILTAPPGSSIKAFANPEFIAANGDVSVISALVIEPAGTVVPDGTVVQFFTNLGKIEDQAKTNDGIARANLVSDTRSGTATVTVVSGGAAPLPAASPSPSAIVNTGGTSAATTTSDTVTVIIGSARPKTVILTANPPRILGSGPARQSKIVANVFDENGNGVVNAPVIFSIQEPTGADATETLASGGAPQYTDNNGQATDFLQTSYPADQPAKTVTVTASVPSGTAVLSSDPVSVQIN
ncbi:MAG: hypothetical protein ACHQNA_11845 [Acidimicrobiales bacterium]